MRAVVGMTLVLLAITAPAEAAGKFLGRFEKWEAHIGGEGRNVYCFVATLPSKSEGKVAKRGEATLMVAHFPKRRSFGQVQVKAGLALKKGSQLLVAVGARSFKLTADGDSGFGGGAKENAEIVAALKAGKVASATSLAAAGAKIVDTYSLDGFTQALTAIDKACGRK